MKRRHVLLLFVMIATGVSAQKLFNAKHTTKDSKSFKLDSVHYGFIDTTLAGQEGYKLSYTYNKWGQVSEIVKSGLHVPGVSAHLDEDHLKRAAFIFEEKRIHHEIWGWLFGFWVDGGYWDGYRITRDYNFLGKLQDVIYYKLYPNSTWIPCFRQSYTYNDAGLWSAITFSEWDVLFGSFREVWKENATYNQDGKPEIFILYKFDKSAGELIPTLKWYYTYNDLGLAQSKTGYLVQVNEQETTMLRSDSLRYLYDSKNRLLTETTYEYLPSDDIWETRQVRDCSYDDEGRLINEKLYKSNRELLDQWKEFEYQASTHFISIEKWHSQFRADYIRDLTFTENEVLVPGFMADLWKGKIDRIEYFDYDWDIQKFSEYPSEYAQFYYSRISEGTTNLDHHKPPGNGLSIYPNPTNDWLIIEKGALLSPLSYRIFSLQGQLILGGKLEGNSLNLEHLDSGSYVLELTTLAGSSERRIIIKD